MRGLNKVQICLMDKKFLRLNYLYILKDEMHNQVRIEAALLIIPVVFVIVILLRIYRSWFVPLQIIKSDCFSTLHIYRKFSVAS
jgi:hypothetical protein